MFLLMLLSACTESGSTRVPVVPDEGVWAYTNEGLVSSTCGESVYFDPDAAFVIYDATDEGFTIEAGDDVFPCTLDGAQLSCATRHSETLTLPMTDTVIGWNIRVDGELSAPNRMAGTQTFSVDCSGALCSLAPQALGFGLPCAWSVAFSARR